MPAIDAAREAAISVIEAESLIRSRGISVAVERRSLRDAPGSILREEISADRDFPPFDRVTMDGIALSFDAFERGTRSFAIERIQAAGTARMSLADPQACIEVMTGAVLPEGCDCVIPVEEIRRADGVATIDANVAVVRMQNVHRRGSDHRSGDPLLAAGARLLSPEIAVCATIGKSEIAVSRKLSVAVVATGDELVDVDDHPEPHQIRTSNSHAVASAIRRSGFAEAELFHAADNRQALEGLFAEVLPRFDLLVASGGVSAGRYDLVPPVLAGLGVRTLFHRVAQRPGFPLLFGVSSDGTPVFALPGNPVSTLISTHRYVLPFLAEASGMERRKRGRAVLAEEYRFEPRLTLFLPVTLEEMEDGLTMARPVVLNGSGDLAALARSDGFIELPAESARFEAGTAWPLYRWV